MHIRDERYMYSFQDLGYRFNAVLIINRGTHYFAPGFFKLEYLLYSRFHIFGFGVRHRLYRDRRTPAYKNASRVYLDFTHFSVLPFIKQLFTHPHRI